MNLKEFLFALNSAKDISPCWSDFLNNQAKRYPGTQCEARWTILTQDKPLAIIRSDNWAVSENNGFHEKSIKLPSKNEAIEGQLRFVRATASEEDWNLLKCHATQQEAELLTALEISRKYLQLTRTRFIIQGLLDANGHPTWIIDRKLCILFQNAHGRTNIENGIHITSDNYNRVRFHDQRSTIAFRNHVDQLTQDGNSALESRSMRLLGRDGHHHGIRLNRLTINGNNDCFPNGAEGENTILKLPLILITLHTHKFVPNVSLQQLKEMFGFTTTEARLVLALLQGKTLTEFAEDNERSMSTVRWHMHNILQRTEYSSQSELIASVLKAIL